MRLNLLRIILCIASIALISNDSSWWWLAVGPWVTFCVFGIVLIIPIFFLIGTWAGAAQADWMSDNFIFTLVFIIPTVLSILFDALIKYWANRFFNRETLALEDPEPASQDNHN